MLGNPPNAASVHQELEILCHDIKRGKTLPRCPRISSNFPKLNIWRQNHLFAQRVCTELLLCTRRPVGSRGDNELTVGSVRQTQAGNDMSICSGGCRNTEERRLSRGWRSQVKPSGKSRTTPPCSSNYSRLGCISPAVKGKKNKFSFPKLALFQFYQLPWLQ